MPITVSQPEGMALGEALLTLTADAQFDLSTVDPETLELSVHQTNGRYLQESWVSEGWGGTRTWLKPHSVVWAPEGLQMVLPPTHTWHLRPNVTYLVDIRDKHSERTPAQRLLWKPLQMPSQPPEPLPPPPPPPPSQPHVYAGPVTLAATPPPSPFQESPPAYEPAQVEPGYPAGYNPNDHQPPAETTAYVDPHHQQAAYDQQGYAETYQQESYAPPPQGADPFLPEDDARRGGFPVLTTVLTLLLAGAGAGFAAWETGRIKGGGLPTFQGTFKRERLLQPAAGATAAGTDAGSAVGEGLPDAPPSRLGGSAPASPPATPVPPPATPVPPPPPPPLPPPPAAAGPTTIPAARAFAQEQGDPQKLVEEAERYIQAGQPEALQGALTLYQNAWDKGRDPRAATAIGRMYDPATHSAATSAMSAANAQNALVWYQRAADKNDPEGLYRLGKLMQSGAIDEPGITPEAGAEYIRKAAAAGYQPAIQEAQTQK